MKKELSNKEQSLTLGVIVLAIITIIAQLAVLANVMKLICRGNKALKIYIDKNKYFEKFSKGDFKKEYNDEDIQF